MAAFINLLVFFEISVINRKHRLIHNSFVEYLATAQLHLHRFSLSKISLVQDGDWPTYNT